MPYVKICPQCNSQRIKLDWNNGGAIAYGLSPEYICEDCGWGGKFFPEVEKPEEDKTLIKP